MLALSLTKMRLFLQLSVLLRNLWAWRISLSFSFAVAKTSLTCNHLQIISSLPNLQTPVRPWLPLKSPALPKVPLSRPLGRTIYMFHLDFSWLLPFSLSCFCPQCLLLRPPMSTLELLIPWLFLRPHLLDHSGSLGHGCQHPPPGNTLFLSLFGFPTDLTHSPGFGCHLYER